MFAEQHTDVFAPANDLGYGFLGLAGATIRRMAMLRLRVCFPALMPLEFIRFGVVDGALT